jgi:3-oxoacyl-[acyl-carrier protein] reductase
MTFGEIQVGDSASIRRRITEADVARFVEMTGDDNPLHVDRAYAETTPFKDIVVHGMLGASLLSTVIGTKLPGEGALWVSQGFEFSAPVRLGDELTVSAAVTAKHDGPRLLDLDARIVNQHGDVVLSGSGRVKVLEPAPVPEPSAVDRPLSAIVTGGAGGIGTAICARLAADGFRVVVAYRADAQRAADLVERIGSAGGEAIAIKADVTRDDDVEELVQTCRRRFGGVGVLVNNASGRIGARPLDQLRWDDVTAQLDVQVRGALSCAQAALPIMRSHGGGKIINITSQVLEAAPAPGWTAYAIAKAGLATLSRHMAEELGPEGITVNCVAPGLTETRLVGDMPEKQRLIAARQTPLRRLARPDDVAGAVAYLASPAADFVTGETLHVNGGRTMA